MGSRRLCRDARAKNSVGFKTYIKRGEAESIQRQPLNTSTSEGNATVKQVTNVADVSVDVHVHVGFNDLSRLSFGT